MSRSSDGAALWAITCYFNPAGYRRRLQNYHEFRRRLAAPLVAVEWSLDGGSSFPAEAAEVLVRVKGGSWLWQKERLLNIGWRHVPAACRKIAWLDCDVFFVSDDWVAAAAARLDDCPLVQPFTRVAELRRDTAWDAAPDLAACDIDYSLLHGWDPNAAAPAALSSNIRQRTHTGLAWAARREAVEGVGLYDACIAGSGNRAILCAALDRCDDAARYLCMGAHWVEHYWAWASRFHERIRGRVATLPGTVYHLWHGDLAHRRYAERHAELAQHGFDPGRDLEPTAEGPWRWSSDKPAMHAFVERYFRERREDG